MDNQDGEQQNNNNIQRFNNPFNLDPDKEDIMIEKRLDRDIFCPLLAMFETFGQGNDYYSMRTVDPLKESLFHSIQALIFPNTTLFQISSILCYIIVIIYIILLCFGLDETNIDKFLRPKLSNVDIIGSFYPKRIKKNYLEFYRLITFHFFHYKFQDIAYNIFNNIVFGAYFELLVKKHIFLLTFFFTGIFSVLTFINFFKEDERICGLNIDINGMFGGFMMLFVLNWDELKFILSGIGRNMTILFIGIYAACSAIVFDANYILCLISFLYGALIFAVITKPIKKEMWKTLVRIFSGVFVLSINMISLIIFILKE